MSKQKIPLSVPDYVNLKTHPLSTMNPSNPKHIGLPTRPSCCRNQIGRGFTSLLPQKGPGLVNQAPPIHRVGTSNLNEVEHSIFEALKCGKCLKDA